MLLHLAILPSILIFFVIMRMDKIEKEPPGLLLRLFLLGAMTIVSAMVFGLFGEGILEEFVDKKSMAYIIIDNFILTALVEEGGKYFVLKKNTWKHPAFNYTFDAVVYAVTVSLGFATLENIIYVVDDSVGVAIVRAIFSVPGHVIDAIFMGYYYGMAKHAEKSIERYRYGNSSDGRVLPLDFDESNAKKSVRANLRKALWVPVLMHGFYDFCLEANNDMFLILFLVFEVIITVTAIRKVRQLSKEDTMM